MVCGKIFIKKRDSYMFVKNVMMMIMMLIAIMILMMIMVMIHDYDSLR